jgi:hypothetical protein
MMRTGSISSRSLTSFGGSQFVSSNGFGRFPSTKQLLGKGSRCPWYQTAASAWDSKRWTTRRTAASRQPLSASPSYRPFTVRYATRSRSRRRGAKFPPRQVAVIDGNADSKSGSRLHEPSMKGRRECRRIACRPLRLLTSGRYVAK